MSKPVTRLATVCVAVGQDVNESPSEPLVELASLGGDPAAGCVIRGFDRDQGGPEGTEGRGTLVVSLRRISGAKPAREEFGEARGRHALRPSAALVVDQLVEVPHDHPVVGANRVAQVVLAEEGADREERRAAVAVAERLRTSDSMGEAPGRLGQGDGVAICGTGRSRVRQDA